MQARPMLGKEYHDVDGWQCRCSMLHMAPLRVRHRHIVQAMVADELGSGHVGESLGVKWLYGRASRQSND